MSEPKILVGPLLRYVDENEATIWVETSQPATVTLRVQLPGQDELIEEEPTWSVHGHHYALLIVEGLTAGSEHEYTVNLDGEAVWPITDGFPASLIRTPDGGDRLRLAFGSCRRVAPFDRAGLDEFGADALVSLAERMAKSDPSEWPDALMFAGDQVYADDPSTETVQRLNAKHSPDDPIRGEVHDFEEYTWLYQESWMTPAVRWLLSTVPTCMILDDHDLRDDWNSSWSWRQETQKQQWFRDRTVGAFGSYWIYQHLGNLSPSELGEDEFFAAVRNAESDEQRSTLLDEFAWRADSEPDSVRWSFHRDFGDNRLVVIDSRCSRDLHPDRRSMVDDKEWDWFVDKCSTPVNHLLIGTTLPFLLLPGIHHLEGWNEATAQGAWGKAYGKVAERMRRIIDLEHWASFRASFDNMTKLLGDLAGSERPPASILVLSGDVHCSYLAEAHLPATVQSATRVHQLVMSPFRNPLSQGVRVASRCLRTDVARRMIKSLARRAGVKEPDIDWKIDSGPWFENGVMLVELDGRRSRVAVETAERHGVQQRLRQLQRTDLAG